MSKKQALRAHRPDHPAPPADGRRIFAWAAFTLAIVVSAIFVIRNAPQNTRVAAIDTVRTVPDPAQGLEQKRLAESIRAIATERDRLAERIAMLEESLKDVTASVPRTTDRLTVVTRGNQPPAATVQTNPAPQAVPAPTPPAPVARAAGPPPDLTPPPYAAPDSQLIRSEFSAEIGVGTSLDALRLLWANVKGNNGKILEGLRPVIGVRDGKPGGPPELVLRVGPVGNMATAAQLCARLAQAAPACRPAIFDGQQLATR